MANLEKKVQENNKTKQKKNKIFREKATDTNVFRIPILFLKEIISRRNRSINVDIDLTTLREHYKNNFNTIEKTKKSQDLENKMRNFYRKYKEMVEKKSKRHIVVIKNIRNILNNLKNNKSRGYNGISNEMFKHSIQTVIPIMITSIISSMINKGFCTENANKGVIITIIKNPTECNQQLTNSRPITLSETISIIIEEYLFTQLCVTSKINVNQFGFRKNSSCMHAVFCIKEIMLETSNEGKNSYALFMDFSKAFDKVNRIKLYNKLIEQCSPKMWLLIVNYYDVSYLYVMDSNGKFSEKIKTTVGVKQGGKISPFNFNVYTNSMIKILLEIGKVYKMKNRYIGVLVYADDSNVKCHTM